MKTRPTIRKLIALTMAVAAMAVISSTWTTGRAGGAAGQLQLEITRSLRAPIGFIPGQSLRVSVGNTAISPGSAVTWTYKVTNTDGVPLYESEGIRVPPGEFRSSDLSRRDLNTVGEPGTRRAQVMVSATIQAPAGSHPEDFPVSMEVINEETGATSGGILLHEVGHYMDTGPSAAAVIGFIPGQRLSLSVFNPPEEGGAPVRVQAYIYDATGRLITRSAEVDLRPDQVQTFRFDRDDLRVAGEERTGRLQVRAVIQVALMDGSVRPVKLPVWMELVENRTGATVGGTYYTGSVTVSDD